MSVAVNLSHVMRMQTVLTLWVAILVSVMWGTLEMERLVQTLMSVPALATTCVMKMQPVPTPMAVTLVIVMNTLWEMD